MTDDRDAAWFNGAALIVALVGLVFVFFQDTWMVVASVALSAGLALHAQAQGEDASAWTSTAGYVCLGIALGALLIDTIGYFV